MIPGHDPALADGSDPGRRRTAAVRPDALHLRDLLFPPDRPDAQETEESAGDAGEVEEGDEVVTQGGVFGRVAAIDEERGFVVLEISTNVKVKVLRSAISGLASEPEKPRRRQPFSCHPEERHDEGSALSIEMGADPSLSLSRARRGESKPREQIPRFARDDR